MIYETDKKIEKIFYNEDERGNSKRKMTGMGTGDAYHSVSIMCDRYSVISIICGSTFYFSPIFQKIIVKLLVT